MQALKNVQLLEKVARYAAVTAAAALVVALARGVAYVSPLTVLLTLAGTAAVWGRQQLQALERRFIFTDWRHADIA